MAYGMWNMQQNGIRTYRRTFNGVNSFVVFLIARAPETLPSARLLVATISALRNKNPHHTPHKRPQIAFQSCWRASRCAASRWECAQRTRRDIVNDLRCETEWCFFAHLDWIAESQLCSRRIESRVFVLLIFRPVNIRRPTHPTHFVEPAVQAQTSATCCLFAGCRAQYAFAHAFVVVSVVVVVASVVASWQRFCHQIVASPFCAQSVFDNGAPSG